MTRQRLFLPLSSAQRTTSPHPIDVCPAQQRQPTSKLNQLFFQKVIGEIGFTVPRSPGDSHRRRQASGVRRQPGAPARVNANKILLYILHRRHAPGRQLAGCVPDASRRPSLETGMT
jgi:hypothetical protein